MAGALHGLSHTTLELQRSTCDAAGKDFALLVKEFLKEFGILVIDILDATSLKRQYFFFLRQPTAE